ncbi:ATP-binding protein [Occultella kanbiaonis]|uniref:ATP-binding protein n=1 Tax=Occultella kanbiaonis TaxID=2675754 RepID=UPI0012BA12D8|nr:ATP-binding protein [Occultella kanbiaonis]
MDSDANPYAPGSGLRPKALEGREHEVTAFDTTVARTRGRLPNRGMVLSGLRGVGKTVLLKSFQERASTMDWLAVAIEARPTDSGRASVRTKLARELVIAARAAGAKRRRLRKALASIGSFSATLGLTGVSIGVERAPGRADSGVLEIDLEEMVSDVAQALREDGLGLAFFIDEMQDLDRELLVALLAVQHAAGQNDWPFYIFGAGLPNLPSVLSDARSYAERLFEYRQIGALSDTAAADALLKPARMMGAGFTPEALDHVVEASGGYPYFLQEYGKAIWDVAPTATFTLEDAHLAITLGTAQLDQGFFPARWDRATRAERDYLRAMAEDGEAGTRSAAVAQRLERDLSSLSPTRDTLIKKGLIYAPEHGRVSYTVPGMASFIRRQSAETT